MGVFLLDDDFFWGVLGGIEWILSSFHFFDFLFLSFF
jgi:hypothetical protein